MQFPISPKMIALLVAMEQCLATYRNAGQSTDRGSVPLNSQAPAFQHVALQNVVEESDDLLEDLEKILAGDVEWDMSKKTQMEMIFGAPFYLKGNNQFQPDFELSGVPSTWDDFESDEEATFLDLNKPSFDQKEELELIGWEAALKDFIQRSAGKHKGNKWLFVNSKFIRGKGYVHMDNTNIEDVIIAYIEKKEKIATRYLSETAIL